MELGVSNNDIHGIKDIARIIPMYNSDCATTVQTSEVVLVWLQYHWSIKLF